MSVLVTKEQLGSALTATNARFLKDVTIKQQATAESGFLATYQLFANTGSGEETAFGAKINIPKDYLVKSCEVKTVTTADDPVEGYEVGQKYIDFTVNTVDGTGNTTHMYILFNDLLTPYTAGNGIDISASNVVSVKLDPAGVDGLTVGANGLKLAAATPDVYSGGVKTSDGITGAMSSADKYKLDNADVEPYTGGNGVDITGHAVTGVVDTANANGLSVGANGFALAAVTASVSGAGGSNGAMLATDKEKLDNADVEAYTGTGAIDITSHVVSVAAASPSTAGVGGEAGTMSATDKEKLDGMTIATDSEITTLINTIFD